MKKTANAGEHVEQRELSVVPTEQHGSFLQNETYSHRTTQQSCFVLFIQMNLETERE